MAKGHNVRYCDICYDLVQHGNPSKQKEVTIDKDYQMVLYSRDGQKYEDPKIVCHDCIKILSYQMLELETRGKRENKTR